MIPQSVKDIAARLEQHGAAHVYLVGGCVRDQILRLTPKDYDLEVYGLPLTHIQQVLTPLYKVSLVGESFSVLKLWDPELNQFLDISVPRAERKIGNGHKGFEIVADPTMSVQEACSRRDFTCNAILMKMDGTIVDPQGGLQDIEDKVLRHCSAAFVEDPLRPLRAFQFVSRFRFELADSTKALCKLLAPTMHELPKERVWEEWKKWALSKYPAWGLINLIEMGWAPDCLVEMFDIPQDPVWHPEGCVGTHTLHVVNAARDIAERDGLDEYNRLVLLFSALTHDMGKPSTTEMVDGRWRALGHCEASVEPAKTFLEGIGAPLLLIQQVCKLVEEHLAHTSMPVPTRRVVNRLARRLSPATLSQLSSLVEADASGRPPLPKNNPFSEWMKIGSELNITQSKPVAIVMGRHIMHMVATGPGMGKILALAYEAQLDDEFSDLEGGLAYVSKLLANLYEAKHEG